MAFITQTMFAYLMLFYIWNKKNDINRKNVFMVALAAFVVMIYIVSYVYLLFKGELDWLKVFGLVSVLCFSMLAIMFSPKPDHKQ